MIIFLNVHVRIAIFEFKCAISTGIKFIGIKKNEMILLTCISASIMIYINHDVETLPLTK